MISPPMVLFDNAIPLTPLMVPELSTLPVIVEFAAKLNPVYNSPVNSPLLSMASTTPVSRLIPLSMVPLLLIVPLTVLVNSPIP